MAIEETSNFLQKTTPKFCPVSLRRVSRSLHSSSPFQSGGSRVCSNRWTSVAEFMQGKSVLTSWIDPIRSVWICVFSKGQRGKDHLHDFDIGSDQILEVLRHILGQSSPVILVILKGTPWPSWITYVLHRVAHGVKHTQCQMITNFDTMERPMEEPQFVCVYDTFKPKAWNA